ncbi:hypothetical protein JTE90_005205 [Oedothorax gibbosus]|uniref:Uncharacterized protein n=1 Tax=Oedothorax gibbosus TaxID=931172 RepID=A0AAV6UMW4_9ARAC|nr:hypothetical protein JTE90_005205 [Oedothorax gibbosus]
MKALLGKQRRLKRCCVEDCVRGRRFVDYRISPGELFLQIRGTTRSLSPAQLLLTDVALLWMMKGRNGTFDISLETIRTSPGNCSSRTAVGVGGQRSRRNNQSEIPVSDLEIDNQTCVPQRFWTYSAWRSTFSTWGR